jgi:hypothetical protein
MQRLAECVTNMPIASSSCPLHDKIRILTPVIQVEQALLVAERFEGQQPCQLSSC